MMGEKRLQMPADAFFLRGGAVSHSRNCVSAVFVGSFAHRNSASLIPVPVGPGFFLYAFSDMHIAFAHMCVRTFWDMWDHWVHPYELMGCWSHLSSPVPVSTGATRR